MYHTWDPVAWDILQQDIRCFSRQVRKTYMTPANWFPLPLHGKRRFVDDSFRRVLQQVWRKRMKYVYRKRAATIRGCQTGRRNFNPPLAALSHKQEICFRQCMAVNYAFFARDSRLRSNPFLNYEWAERMQPIWDGFINTSWWTSHIRKSSAFMMVVGLNEIG